MLKYYVLCYCFLQCELWMNEGSQLLISVGRRAHEDSKPQHVAELIHSLERFVEHGKTRQELRLQKVDVHVVACTLNLFSSICDQCFNFVRTAFYYCLIVVMTYLCVGPSVMKQFKFCDSFGKMLALNAIFLQDF